MEKINPTQAAYPVSNIQPTHEKVHFGGPPISNVQKTGLPQQSNNKFVPADQQLSTLKEVFDDKTLKRMGVVECASCATRTYQDQSDDPGVSFKAPTRLNPAQAATAVISHEMEHVSNEQADAKKEGKEVIAQSVQIFHSICPECGKSYVSGGVTKTTTASESNPYKDAMTNKAAGNLVDMLL
jgi:hypothetical protein